MSVEEHRKRAAAKLNFAVVTISDTRSPAEDASGRLIGELIEVAGHALSEHLLVRDEVPGIRHRVTALVGRSDVDVVVLTGGTGFAPRDLTVEAVTPLLQTPIEGFGELFRMLSFQEVGAAAMLSRACAGIVNGRLVFALPGSKAAVRLAMDRLILTEAGHLLDQIRRSST